MANIDTLVDWSNPIHRDRLQDCLKTLDREKSYWVKIKKYHPKRTLDQNNYWWIGIIYPVCEFHGFDPHIEENRLRIHEKLKKQFNGEVVEFKRKCFEVIDQKILEEEHIFEYLEKKEWSNLTISKDKNILIPLYLVRHIDDVSKYGREIEVIDYETLPRSTTANDTLEMTLLIEKVRDYYALEHNFYISAPNEKQTS